MCFLHDTVVIVPLSDPTVFQLSHWVILKMWRANNQWTFQSWGEWVSKLHECSWLLRLTHNVNSSLSTLPWSRHYWSEGTCYMCASAEDRISVAASASSLLRKQLFHQIVHVHGCLLCSDHIRFVMIELSCILEMSVLCYCVFSCPLCSTYAEGACEGLASAPHKSSRTLLSKSLIYQ